MTSMKHKVYSMYSMEKLIILGIKKLILIAKYIDFLIKNIPYHGKLLNIDRILLRTLLADFKKL